MENHRILGTASIGWPGTARLKRKAIRSWRVKDFERWLIYAVRGDVLVLHRVVSGNMNLLRLRFD
jgi:hypothetical protein